jgi:hypothetical protein
MFIIVQHCYANANSGGLIISEEKLFLRFAFYFGIATNICSATPYPHIHILCVVNVFVCVCACVPYGCEKNIAIVEKKTRGQLLDYKWFTLSLPRLHTHNTVP